MFLVSLPTLGSDTCAFSQATYFNTKVQTGQYTDGTCFVFVSPRYSQNMIYRSHVFTDRGQHLIFNSFGDGPSSVDTGSRVFVHVFKNPLLDIKLVKNIIHVSLGAQFSILINAKTSEIQNNSVGINFKVSPQVSRTNDGGVEVETFSESYIDFGYKTGSSPIAGLGRSHSIFQVSRKKCESPNSKLIDIVNYDPYWKYKGWSELNGYFKEVCPE